MCEHSKVSFPLFYFFLFSLWRLNGSLMAPLTAHSNWLLLPFNRKHHRLPPWAATSLPLSPSGSSSCVLPQQQQQAAVTPTTAAHAALLHHFRASHHHNNHLYPYPLLVPHCKPTLLFSLMNFLAFNWSCIEFDVGCVNFIEFFVGKNLIDELNMFMT